MSSHANEIVSGERFAFGANWTDFLRQLDDDRIAEAENSLRTMLDRQSLQGLRFLDIGSGSGLFSLAARRLGAQVHSFDYDPQSVACTRQLRERHDKADPGWAVEEGSVLDAAYMSQLGSFDVVYSWGVLHHTGQLWTALDRVAGNVAPQGRLFLAIYNHQGWVSRYWTAVKRSYVSRRALRWPLLLLHAPYLVGLRWLVRRFQGGRRLDRGMSLWHDMVDWVGGYPFEAARPEDVFRFYRDRGFVLRELKTCGGRHGCNEFVFVRDSAGPTSP